MDEIVYGSLIGMAERVRAGEISPVELVEAHLARIERLNPKLNAFANVDAERARGRAKAAEAAAAAPGGKNALGTLHGVPVTVKSSIDVAGLRMRMRQRAAKRQHAGNRRAAGGEAARSRRNHSGKYQRAGISDGVRERQFDLWAREQSLGPGANGGRVERRGIGGDRGGMFCRRSGQRWRRIDSDPGAFHRDLRAEADTRKDSIYGTLPGLGGSVCLSWRGGADGANGARCGAAFRSDGRA